jgi:hypothetical protein
MGSVWAGEPTIRVPGDPVEDECFFGALCGVVETLTCRSGLAPYGYEACGAYGRPDPFDLLATTAECVVGGQIAQELAPAGLRVLNRVLTRTEVGIIGCALGAGSDVAFGYNPLGDLR